MPSQPVHRRLTIASGLVALLANALVWRDMPWQVYVGIAVTLRPELTPDLDVTKRRFGWLGNFLGLSAYAELVGHRRGLHHRHWEEAVSKPWLVLMFSHIPGLGTAPRTFMIFIPICLFWLLTGWWTDELIKLAWGMWLGMSWSDSWHVAADIIVSDLKETSTRFWGRRRHKYLKEKRNASSNRKS